MGLMDLISFGAQFIPGVGPMISKGIDAASGVIGDAGQVMGQAAGSGADAKQAQALLELQKNNQALNQFGMQQNAQFNQGGLDLQRKQFDESSEASRMKRALIGQLLGNMQDVNISVPGIQTAQVTGGLRPSALGDAGRSIAREMSDRALSQARTGNQYQGGSILPAPQLSPVNTDVGGGFLQTASLIASLLGSGGAAGNLGASGQKDYTKLDIPKLPIANQLPPNLPVVPGLVRPEGY